MWVQEEGVEQKRKSRKKAMETKKRWWRSRNARRIERGREESEGKWDEDYGVTEGDIKNKGPEDKWDQEKKKEQVEKGKWIFCVK